MKRKFCLTPNPSQAGLDIPTVPKVTERLRDIRLDRDMCAQANNSCHGDDLDTSPIIGRDVNVADTTAYTIPVDTSSYCTPVDSMEYRNPLDRQLSTESDGQCPPWTYRDNPQYPEDVFDEINFQVGSLSSSLSSSFSRSLGQSDLEAMTRLRASTITPGEDITDRKLPTVFRWEGGGKNVYLSGSFDGWKTKIPMVKSQGDFYTIVELPEGEHQYKFLVDDEWVCDTNVCKVDMEQQVNNDLGSKNNNVKVSASDFEVFEALAMDSNSSSDKSGSPTGEYSQHIPSRSTGTGFHHGGPPILPPHLLQVILNKEIPLHCEPTLLPEPNHVMLNHLYALSIKDGVMVLSATHRYRKKYVTTLLYKPI